jgi:hypothetical protein
MDYQNCFYDVFLEESEMYQLLFTSKNIDPSQNYGWLKVSAYV